MVLTVMEIMMSKIIRRMEITTMMLTPSCSLLRLLVARVKVASDFRPIRLLFPFGIKCRAPTSHRGGNSAQWRQMTTKGQQRERPANADLPLLPNYGSLSPTIEGEICDWCDYAASCAGNLRNHTRTRKSTTIYAMVVVVWVGR